MTDQIAGFIIPIGFLAMFYFFAIRPQAKKEKQVKEMRSNLKSGDQIVTIGGIYGKILNVKDDVVVIEVGASKTKMEMARWAIGSIVTKNESKSNDIAE